MPCQACGIEGPTKYVEFYQNIGMLVTRRMWHVKGELCRPCIGSYFRSYTLTTLFLGWWGLISFFLTPFILLNNVIRYLLALQLEKPGIAAMNTPIGQAAPPAGAGSFKFKIIYGAIVCVIGLGVAAYYNVDFVEKHAPTVNARLHNGEISNDADAEYSVAKLAEDEKALGADYASKDWAGFRSEMLSREPYLLDLTAQNDKLQRRISLERGTSLGNDVCEKLALDEFGPALNHYAKVQNDAFSYIKSTTTPTPTTDSTLKALTDREDAALRQMHAFFADSKSHGCDK